MTDDEREKEIQEILDRGLPLAEHEYGLEEWDVKELNRLYGREDVPACVFRFGKKIYWTLKPEK